jgi:chaperone BCS1
MNDLFNQVIETIRNSMDNQFMSGGLVLMFVGSVIALLRNLPGRIWSLLKRQFTVSVDILSTDSLYGWTISWLNVHPYCKRARRLSASTSDGDGEVPVASTSSGKGASEDNKPKVLFTPAPGFHLLWVKGRPVWLTRERKEPSEKRSWSIFPETMTLGTFGRNGTPIRRILEEARDLAYKDENLVGIYILDYGSWYRIHEVVPRTMESVILPSGVSEALLEDLRTFFNSESWYSERGIPWRRGLLFEGIPGTGKTSIVTALAGELGLDLYICNITDKGMNDERLVSSLLNVKPHSAVLLEDIDGLVNGRDLSSDNGVTFSGLLNALDGVASKPGIVTFMTTNHAENLDPALVRSGRVDLRQSFTHATAEQVERFYHRFYNGASRPTMDVASYKQSSTIADIQAILMDNRNDPLKALSVLLKDQT